MITESTHLSLATRPYTWMAMVVSASVVLSYGLACAVPFAALAAIAALTLGRRDALLLVGLAWLSNQAIGFALLNYPWDFETFAWGLALLAVSILATLGTALCATRVGALLKIFVALVAFLSAFAIYEGLLFLVTVAVGEGMETYEPEVVAKIFALNAAVFVAFLAASRLRLPRTSRQPDPARSAV